MPALKDLTGKTFGYLTVIERRGSKGRNPTWLCKCRCGKEKLIPSYLLLKNRVQSCGCYKREKMTKHGHSRSATYQTWENMIQRCTNPRSTKYYLHGGRGIVVCDRCLDFKCFFEDMGEKPEGKTLDRIDNEGNYEPCNCKWATQEEQANNTRSNRYFATSRGTYTMAQIARMVGVTPQSIECRVKSGVRGDALLSPPHQGRKQSTIS